MRIILYTNLINPINKIKKNLKQIFLTNNNFDKFKSCIFRYQIKIIFIKIMYDKKYIFY